ncbi:hypothetical protein [Synechococcus sp. MIT S9504]|uniref:hypothetical protein n=1 Tax=Synechococcus sp. MIT S9504 TaxID=1801628 RepID=UPI0007BBED61|nr:hypothetical protein [Synechococcus sp. MIT S9504]KZR85313.1 hypothetical protein MITS9504_02219 [Synechococcus sp. MIT S9504]
MIFSRLSFLNAAAGLALLCAGDAAIRGVYAHGGHGGGEQLPDGEFRATPVITIEGHGGFETNLDGKPEHYAIDGQFGYVFEWGLPNNGIFAIEATIGPSVVYGEAEHFYGVVHAHGDDHEDHGDHDDHGHEDHDDHDEHGHENHDDHGHEDHDEHDDHGHEDHDDHDEHGHDDHHGHAHESGAPFKRTDVRGYLAARYQPNEQLAFQVSWMPYYVTGPGEEFGEGLKNEVGVNVTYAFGDGDVNFALGDGLEDVIDGVFISVENRTGWESDSTYIGNYTDVWPGFGFNVDLLNITLSGGPRFYVPGSYSGLSSRTDWGGELELEYPITDKIALFAHWEPVYSTEDWGSEGGKGWNHHIGTGVTFSF